MKNIIADIYASPNVNKSQRIAEMTADWRNDRIRRQAGTPVGEVS